MGGVPRHSLYQETIGSLCVADYKGVGSQYVNDGKCIIQHNARHNSEN